VGGHRVQLVRSPDAVDQRLLALGNRTAISDYLDAVHGQGFLPIRCNSRSCFDPPEPGSPSGAAKNRWVESAETGDSARPA
jgi:hypothetical protein